MTEPTDVVVSDPPLRKAIYLTRNAAGQAVSNVPHLVAGEATWYDFGADNQGTRTLALNIIEHRIRPIKQHFPKMKADPMVPGQIAGEACWCAWCLHREFARRFLVPLDPDAGATIPQASLDDWFFQWISAYEEGQ